MSLFRRTPVAESEQRDISSLPWIAGGDSPLAQLSLDGALSLIPVYGAVRKISDDFATLTPHRFERVAGDDRRPRPLPAMFRHPSNKGTIVDWLSRYCTSQLLRGNAYGLRVAQDPLESGLPSMVEWLHPDKIKPYGASDWLYEGKFLSGDKVLHVPSMVLPGSRLGVSPMTAARVLVESGRDAAKFRRDWLRNRAVPGMHAKNTAMTLTADEASTAKERMKATVRSGEPLVTGNDWDVTLLQLSADDAGFAITAKLDATQVEVIYGLPAGRLGGDVGGSLTYTTRDMNQLEYVQCLRPHIERFEAAFDLELAENDYVKLDVNGLLRSDVKTRMGNYQIARTIGLYNLDEIRAMEDEEPLPNGLGQDYAPLKMAPAAAPTPQETP